MLLFSQCDCEMQDMGIKDPEIVELVNQIEELERKLYAHPLHKVYPIVQNNSAMLIFHKVFECIMLLTFSFAQPFHCANSVSRCASDEMFPKESRGEP